MSSLLRNMMGQTFLMAEADEGGDGGDGGGGESAEQKAAAAAVVSATAAKVKADEERKRADDEKKGKPTAAEAKLLKEVMEKKAAVTASNAAREAATVALEAANLKLKDFEGIDPVEIKKLLQERKTAEEDKLKAEGNWDKLKQQIVDANVKDRQVLSDEINTLKAGSSDLNKQIAELTVGNAFGQSKFINEEMALTPVKARVVYASHFESKGGKVIAFDKPAGESGRTMMVDGRGDPLSFEAAIAKIVDNDPDRDQMLKSKLKPGAGSSTAGGRKPAGEDAGKSSKDKISAGLLSLQIARKK